MEGGDGADAAGRAALDSLAGAAQLQRALGQREARDPEAAGAEARPQAPETGGGAAATAGASADGPMGGFASVERPQEAQEEEGAVEQLMEGVAELVDLVGPSQSTDEGEAQEAKEEAAARRASSRRKKAPVIYGDEESDEELGKVQSKKRGQKALKPPPAQPVRASKRSRVQKSYAASNSGTESNDEQTKRAPEPRPSQARSRKRRQAPGSPQSAKFEPPPIIEVPPPLPFTDNKPRKSAPRSRSPSQTYGGTSTSRKCEFCMHATDMCALLICSACKRAYHSRCLVQRFKPFWPSEGTTEERLEKLQASSDRRVNFLRCGPCRAVFGEFVDMPDEFLQSCKCPTCERPELLASFRCLKIKQMLIERDEMKEMQRLKKTAKSTTATGNVSNDTSTVNNSSDKANISDNTSSSTKSGSASRRKSARPVRITRGSSRDIEETESVTGSLENGQLAGASSVVVAIEDAVEAVADMKLTDTTAGDAMKQPEDVEMVAVDESSFVQQLAPEQENGEGQHLQPDMELHRRGQQRGIEEGGSDMQSVKPDATNEQTQQSPATPKQNESPKSASKKRSRPSKDISKEPISSFEDFEGPEIFNGVELTTDGELMRFRTICMPFRSESPDARATFDEGTRAYSVQKLSASIIKSGHFGWRPKHPGRVYCVCCKCDMSLQSFVDHCKFPKGFDVKDHMLVVHNDEISCTPLYRFIKSLKYKYKLLTADTPKKANSKKSSSRQERKPRSSKAKPDANLLIEAPIDPAILAERIPRKSEMAKSNGEKEASAMEVVTNGEGKLPDFPAGELEPAFQRLKRVAIVKRNWRSKLSDALQASDHAREQLDFLVKVVSLHKSFAKIIPGNDTRETLRDSMHDMPVGTARRRTGWRALNTRGRLGRSIFCDCCEAAMPAREFIEHSDLPIVWDDEDDLYVSETTYGWVQPFLKFRKDIKALAQAEDGKYVAGMLAPCQEYPPSPNSLAPVGLELASQ